MCSVRGISTRLPSNCSGCEHSCTRLNVQNVRSDFGHDAGNFTPRRERNLGFHLIFASHGQRVRKTETDGMHAQLHVPRLQLRCRNVLDTELRWRAITTKNDSAHKNSVRPRGVIPGAATTTPVDQATTATAAGAGRAGVRQLRRSDPVPAISDPSLAGLHNRRD